MKSAIVLGTLLLAGCATCRDHPVACAAITGVVAASVVLSIDHHRGDPSDPLHRRMSPCEPIGVTQCGP